MGTQICPDCGAAVPASAPDRMCPSCLLKLGFHRNAADWIRQYRLIEVIGEGGFGTVWLAEQEEPIRRQVALKILKPGMDTREIVARFEAERQAVALMDHPHIAKVFEAGATENGRPFLVMELVRGLPITTFCDQRRLSTRQRIELLISVCEAVQHAHQKGVIHRDLKPSNVLVSEENGRAEPKVIDFGVAKAIDGPLTEKTLLTRAHQFIGTPAYMSPEQAGFGGLDIDTRTDIYSLGALLSELMTGHPPFSARDLAGKGRESVLRVIRDEEPRRPSTRLSVLPPEEMRQIADRRGESPQHLSKLLRHELDWIILRALEKDRSQRYATANGLARDLRHFLAGEAVGAAPPTLPYRARKFIRKNRSGVALAGALVLLLCTIAFAAIWEAARVTRYARNEHRLRSVAESNEFILRNTVYAADMEAVAQGLERLDDENARIELEKYGKADGVPDLRGWEWRHLYSLAVGEPSRGIQGHTNVITAVQWSDPGRRLLSASFDGTVREWEFSSGKEVRNWSIPSAQWSAVAVHPSGTRAVAVNQQNQAMLIDLPSGTHRMVPLTPKGPRYSIAAAPDGSAFLHSVAGWGFASQNGRTFVCDLEFADCREIPEAGSRSAFSPDGKWLATGSWDERIKLWSWPGLEPVGELGPVTGVASLHCSPDGHKLVAGGVDGEITLWDVPGKTLIARRRVAAGIIGCVRFSPDGGTIITAGGDQMIRLWSGKTLELQRGLRGYGSTVWEVLWTPSGESLVTTSPRSGIRVRAAEPSRFPQITGLRKTRPVRFSSDSKYLAAGFANEREVAIWSMTDGTKQGHITGPYEVCGFLPGNKGLVLQDAKSENLTFCDVPTLSILQTKTLEPSDGVTVNMCSAWSRDGTMLARGTEQGAIVVWNTATGRLIGLPRQAGKVHGLAFSHDGRWLLSGGAGGGRLWDTAGWREVKFFGDSSPSFSCDVSFSEDDRLVAICSMLGPCLVYERQSGRRVAELPHGEQAVIAAQGRSVITITQSSVRFWNLAAQREAGVLKLEGGAGSFLSLSPDQTVLATITADQTLRTWRAPLLPPMH